MGGWGGGRKGVGSKLVNSASDWKMTTCFLFTAPSFDGCFHCGKVCVCFYQYNRVILCAEGKKKKVS